MAKTRNLPITGRRRGLINLSTALGRLQQTTFHISPDLLKWLLERDEERQKPS